MIEITVETESDINDFLVDDKELFFDAIINSIEYGFKNDKDTVRVVEFHIMDVKNVMSIDMDRADWLESLYLAISYYESIEKYEKCTRVRDLIELMSY